MADEKLTQLADPASAIASYLDDLLYTATSTALDEEQAQPEVSVAAEVKVETEVEAEVSEPVVQEPEVQIPVIQEAAVTEPAVDVPAPEPEIVKPVAPPQPVVPEPVAVREIETPAPVVQPNKEDGAQQPPAAPPSRPDWSETPFECLIFTVAGLQLAVPLVLLGAIHRIEEEIRPIPGSPRWYMGIRPDRDLNLRVVDSAEWIMAGRVPDNARENYRFVIRLDNSEWGLACDEVAQSFTLKPDEVRWRTGRSKRPWLAGTVVNHMCALIDVQAMADLLRRAEREQHLDLS